MIQYLTSYFQYFYRNLPKFANGPIPTPCDLPVHLTQTQEPMAVRRSKVVASSVLRQVGTKSSRTEHGWPDQNTIQLSTANKICILMTENLLSCSHSDRPQSRSEACCRSDYASNDNRRVEVIKDEHSCMEHLKKCLLDNRCIVFSSEALSASIIQYCNLALHSRFLDKNTYLLRKETTCTLADHGS